MPSIPVYEAEHIVSEAHVGVKQGDKFLIQTDSLTGWEWEFPATIHDCLQLIGNRPVSSRNTDPEAVGNGWTTHDVFLARSACGVEISSN